MPLAAIAFLLAGAAAPQPAVQPAPPPAAAPAAPRAPAIASFDSYKLIGELNIFNSSRTGPVREGAQLHVDTISFVGTLESAKGLLAFFDSTNSTFRKAAAQGGLIADFTVTKIEKDRVELTRSGKAVTLGMGQQLRRPPGGDWSAGAGSSLEAMPADASSSATATQSPQAIPADASDTLRKLMEKRQQELKQ